MKKLMHILISAFVLISFSVATASKTTSYQKQKRGRGKLSTSGILKVKSFPGPQGEVFVVIRSGGHLQGLPYVIEIRPTCGQKNKSWQDLRGRDSMSACQVDLNSPALNPQGNQILIKINPVDLEYRNSMIEKNRFDVLDRCVKTPTTESFPIDHICD